MGAALGAPHEAATALDVASLGTGIGAFTAEGGSTSNATRRDEMMGEPAGEVWHDEEGDAEAEVVGDLTGPTDEKNR